MMGVSFVTSPHWFPTLCSDVSFQATLNCKWEHLWQQWKKFRTNLKRKQLEKFKSATFHRYMQFYDRSLNFNDSIDSNLKRLRLCSTQQKFNWCRNLSCDAHCRKLFLRSVFRESFRFVELVKVLVKRESRAGYTDRWRSFNYSTTIKSSVG